MSTDEFEVRQGVSWIRSGYGQLRGIVIGTTDDHIEVLPVRPLNENIKCYDDCGAIKNIHQHNVRLRDCPPPFDAAYKRFSEGLYVYANLEESLKFDSKACNDLNMTVVDKGSYITEDMLEELYNHPWSEQLEKEKVLSFKDRIVDAQSLCPWETEIVENDEYSL